MEVPLTVLEPQQSLRLLELPPELDDLLASSGPFKLCFKSASPSNSHVSSTTPVSPTTKSASYLHLCTPHQSYQIRQVSTSNSVYVLAPSATISHPSSNFPNQTNTEFDGVTSASRGMTALSKIDTMLEALPVSHDVKTMLERLLPVYDDSPGASSAGEAETDFLACSTTASKSSLFDDIPAPDAQCEEAWREVTGFEFAGRCSRAGKAKALDAWKVVLDHAHLERVDLNSKVDFGILLKTAQLEPIDAAVAEALLRFLGEGEGEYSTADYLKLDRARTVRWSGLTLLQVSSQRANTPQSLRKDDHLSRWQDLLPEAWRGEATLEKLPVGCYTVMAVDGQETILWNGLDQSDVALAQEAAPEVAADKAAAGKRKWHEKFKAQRKEIKK